MPEGTLWGEPVFTVTAAHHWNAVTVHNAIDPLDAIRDALETLNFEIDTDRLVGRDVIHPKPTSPPTARRLMRGQHGYIEELDVLQTTLFSEAV